MTPYDDSHVTPGEIADYLHSLSPTNMSFTSPPNLTQPDTSADIIRPRKLGTVNCINVARVGEPILRYFGASALCGATGQAHPTQEQAEADVLAWADGKPVAYEQHAVVPLGSLGSATEMVATNDGMEYLNWRQLRAQLNAVSDERLLAEPVLFTYLNNYGDTTVYPVKLLAESTHPEDITHMLSVSEEYDWELTYNLNADDLSDFDLKPLRQLPPGGLFLHFTDMDEDAEQATAWLATPNPHTPPPAPVAPPVPGPAI
jgi:hypothetical protein